jgi:hypothetical protein
MNDAHLLVTTIVDLYASVHRQLREEIDDLEINTLNWTPGPNTSSIGTLIVHMLGSETEMLRSVLALPSNRSRDAEFAAQIHTRNELSLKIDAADSDLQQLGLSIAATDLQALRTRPNKSIPQLGLFWLISNYGHAREHLAQIQLTKQLYFLSYGEAGGRNSSSESLQEG